MIMFEFCYQNEDLHMMFSVSVVGSAVKNECEISVTASMLTRVNRKVSLLFLGLILRVYFHTVSQCVLIQLILENPNKKKNCAKH